MMTTDKRRKRQPTTASCIDRTPRDYDAVALSDAQERRRRSECNSTSSTGSSSVASRGESWMTKVTSAMSQRIFAGKKLGSSRSTQVMPLATMSASPSSTQLDDNSHEERALSLVSPSAYTDAHYMTETPYQQQQQHSMRQASSANSFVCATAESGLLPMSTPVERVDWCPNIVYDVAGDDDSGTSDAYQHIAPPHNHRQHQRQSVVHSIHVQSPRRSNGQANQRSTTHVGAGGSDKVMPHKHEHNDTNDNDDDCEITLVRTAASDRRRRATASDVPTRTAGQDRDGSGIDKARYDAETCSATSPQQHNVCDATPILKDFFTRSAASGHGLREQQREARRNARYKSSRQRQEHLRARVDADERAQATALQQLRVEQLQRVHDERRTCVRREAASAYKHFAAHTMHEHTQFTSERERWESDFEDEMRLLSLAFRKASAKTRHDTSNVDSAAAAATIDAFDRPMTVAGLALPEALSLLRRDANNYEKRLKTAEARMVHDSHCDTDIDAWRCIATSIHNSNNHDEQRQTRQRTGSIDILRFHDDDDDGCVRASDDATATPTESCTTRTDAQSVQIDALLAERECLRERIAALEQQLVRSASPSASTVATTT